MRGTCASEAGRPQFPHLPWRKRNSLAPAAALFCFRTLHRASLISWEAL
jgi:hypothetical protein